MPYSDVAVIIPCKDESATIGDLVTAFQDTLPGAAVWVCDNNSSDDTAACAQAAGAQVVFEGTPGKGAAVRTLIAQTDADIVVMIDGDGTYPVASAPALIAPVRSGTADMVVGVRKARLGRGAYPPLHRVGNRFFVLTANLLVGGGHRDILSGYRAFRGPVLRGFDPTGNGFELESELTLAAMRERWRVAQVDVPYDARPDNSDSKLNTFQDGFKILGTLLRGARAARAGRRG